MSGKALVTLKALDIEQVAEVWIEVSSGPLAFVKALGTSGEWLEKLFPHGEAMQFALWLGESGKFDWQLIDWQFKPTEGSYAKSLAYLASFGEEAPIVKRLVFWPKGQDAPWAKETVKVISEGAIDVETNLCAIISIEGKLTKNGSRFWACQTNDGKRANVFEHNGDNRDQTARFKVAGYDLGSIEIGQKQTWRRNPIAISLKKDGDFWSVVTVNDKPEGAGPDPIYTPDHRLVRGYVIGQALTFLSDSILPEPAKVWDTETTGDQWDDEIISIAVTWDNPSGSTGVWKTLVKPRNLDRVATFTHKHGLTADMLENAPTFSDIYHLLSANLDTDRWAIYNAPFDVSMLFNNCLLNGLTPLTPLAVLDVMILASQYYGDWDTERQQYRYKSLEFMVKAFGEPFEGEAHDAAQDALMTHKVLTWLAEGKPIHEATEQEDPYRL